MPSTNRTVKSPCCLVFVVYQLSYHLPPPMLAIQFSFGCYKQQAMDNLIFVLHDTFQCYYYFMNNNQADNNQGMSLSKLWYCTLNRNQNCTDSLETSWCMLLSLNWNFRIYGDHFLKCVSLPTAQGQCIWAYFGKETPTLDGTSLCYTCIDWT